MKKIILIILLIQSLFCFADIADIQLSMNDNNVVLNDEFIVNLDTSSLTGLGIISYEISLNFDNSYLQFMEIISDGTISTNGITNSAISGNALNIVSIFTQSLIGEGTLLKVKFKAINHGTTTLDYSSALFNTTATSNFSGGSVTIVNAPTETMLSVGNYMEPNGTDFEVEIIATAIAGKNCISFEFDFSFDETVLDFLGTSSAGCLTENWTINYAENGSIVKFVGIDTAPISEDGILIKLLFHVLETASDDCELNLYNVLLNTIEEVVIENGTFYIDTSFVLPPQNVTLNPLDVGIRLSWNEVPNATYYEVYSSLSPNTVFELIQTGVFPQIGMKFYLDILTGENKGFYKIKACNNN